MKLKCLSRSGKTLVEELIVPNQDQGTLMDLKREFYRKLPKYYPDRQRWTFEGKPIDDETIPLSKCGLKSGDTVVFKDLGPQIGWRTVFVIEYLGPLFIYPVFYYCGDWIYGQSVVHNRVQTIAFYMLMMHFMKRELETLFIHRFSHGTMPFTNVFKNSFHYWVLSGVLIAWQVMSPYGISDQSDAYIGACLLLFAYGQLSNLITHIKLRNLRSPGGKERKIPYGYGFNLVSCPNYFFESVSWFAFFLLTRTWTAALFLMFSVGQMYIWAIKKHKNYRCEFPNYPKNRKAMFPFVA